MKREVGWLFRNSRLRRIIPVNIIVFATPREGNKLPELEEEDDCCQQKAEFDQQSILFGFAFEVSGVPC